eukprot:jgi/Botrbrau1/20839/Bobra.0156s0064.1
MLHCLGGVPLLLPLIANLDAQTKAGGQTGGVGEDQTRAVEVFNLLAAVLQNSPSNRQSLLQISGVAVAGWLLSQRSPRHLSVDLLKAVMGLAEAVQLSPELRAHVIAHLLLNLRLWAPSALPAQRAMLNHATHLLKHEARLVSELLPVTKVLDAVRQYYGPNQETSRGSPASPALSPNDLRIVRRSLLLDVAGTVLQKLSVPPYRAAPLQPDVVQALVAFVGDSADAAMLEDVLDLLLLLLRSSSPARPLLLPLLQAMGGPALFISLLQREGQALRLQGIRTLALLLASISADAPRTASADSSSRGAGGPGWVPPAGFEPTGLWALVGESLMTFPLTRPLRDGLLEFLCPAGSPGLLGTSGAPLFAAPVVGILLRLLPTCSDARERLATLSALSFLIVEGPKEYRAAVVGQQAFEEPLLDLLQDSSPCMARTAHSPAEEGGVPEAEVQGPEEKAIWGILRALYRHCLAEVPRGWLLLQRGLCRLRAFGERGVAPGWRLAQELVADVAEEVLLQVEREAIAASSSADEAWLLISFLANDRCRDNVLGLLSLMDDLLAGAVMGRQGESPGPPARALAWAQQEDTSAIPPEAWLALGLPDYASLQAQDDHMGSVTLRTAKAATGLLGALVRATDSNASTSPRSGTALSPRFWYSESFRSRSTGSGSNPTTPDGIDRGNRGPFAASGLRQGLTERGARVVLHLLLLLLRQPRHTQAASDDLLRLLPLFIDASVSSSKDRVHLIMACLVRLRNVLQAGAAGPEELREVARVAAGVASASWVPLNSTLPGAPPHPHRPPLLGEG